MALTPSGRVRERDLHAACVQPHSWLAFRLAARTLRAAAEGKKGRAPQLMRRAA